MDLITGYYNGSLMVSVDFIKNVVAYTNWPIDIIMDKLKIHNELRSEIYGVILKERLEFFNESHIFADIVNAVIFHGQSYIKPEFIMIDENGLSIENMSILKRIHYHTDIFLLGLKLQNVWDLDSIIKIREKDASTYFNLLKKYNIRYCIRTIIILFTTDCHQQSVVNEYLIPNNMRQYNDYSDILVLNMATIDAQLFKTEEMQILVTWYQKYIVDKMSASQYLKRLDTYPKEILSVIASLTIKDCYDKCFDNTMVDMNKCAYFFNRAGALENSVENIRNLMAHIGWSLDEAMKMNGVDDDLKSLVSKSLEFINNGGE